MNTPMTDHQHGRLFRFFFWNDMHIRAPHLLEEHGTYPLANEKAAWAVECARGEHSIEPPDFIASGGDIINGEIPNYDEDFQYMQSLILDRIDVPFLPCLGNHENRQGEGIPEQNAAYDHLYGPKWHTYLYTHSGIGFIVVDTSGAHRLGDLVTEARNSFIERAFVRLDGMPCFVITHVPLISFRDLEPYKASFGFSSWRVLDLRMLELAGRHSDTVIAVLSGHIHLSAAREYGGILHMMTGGTGGYPSDFAAFDVYSDRVEMKMHSAPDQWLDKGGDIHGARRHGTNYTDSDHPDHESYLWGNPDEREVTIRLDAKKVPDQDAVGTLAVFHEQEPGKWVRGSPDLT